jgi:hypothetical protein
MQPNNYMSPLAIRTMSTNLKWVSKVDFIFANIEFYFSTHNPTSSKPRLECDPKLRKIGQKTTRLNSQSRPRIQRSNGYPKFILYLETDNFTFQPIIPLRPNLGLECGPKLRKYGPITTCLRSQSRPCLQPSNRYPKLISYFETKNFTFQPIIPLRSDSGQECHLKLRKCGPGTTLIHTQSRPRLQPSNGYPKLISYLETKNFTFQPIIPLCSGPGMWPEVEKMRPKNYMSPLAIKTMSTTLKWVSKFDFIFGNGEFTFQPIIPLHSNSGLECDPKLRKCSPRTKRFLS